MSGADEPNLSILVMGEALVDVVTRGDDVDEHVGGSPANVAFGLGRLGHDVALATWIGSDRRGKRIARTCRRADVKLVPGSDKAPRTSVANAEIDAEGHATYHFDLTWVLPTLPHISEVGHVHTGSIGATLEPGGTQVVGALKAAHGEATISYDPNARPTLMGDPREARNRVEEIVVLSDVVKASDEDIEWFYPDRTIDDVVQDWLTLGPSLVVVTRGDKGATFAMSGADPVMAPSPDVQKVDTVGAGDSFMAGLLSGLLDAGLLGGEGARVKLGHATPDDVLPAVQRAIETSGITVSRAGAYAPTRKALGTVRGVAKL
jgi:fructokinase